MVVNTFSYYHQYTYQPCVCVCVVAGWSSRRGYRGRRRRGNGGWERIPRKKARRQEEEEEEEEDDNQVDKGHTPAPFVAARDQHVS